MFSEKMYSRAPTMMRIFDAVGLSGIMISVRVGLRIMRMRAYERGVRRSKRQGGRVVLTAVPRGEHPFHRFGRRNSAGSSDSTLIPPVPPLPNSAELSARGLDSGKSRESRGCKLDVVSASGSWMGMAGRRSHSHVYVAVYDLPPASTCVSVVAPR